jgi:hypothetical protein
MPAYFHKFIFPLDLPGPFAIVREIQKKLARYISGKLKGLVLDCRKFRRLCIKCHGNQ